MYEEVNTDELRALAAAGDVSDSDGEDRLTYLNALVNAGPTLFAAYDARKHLLADRSKLLERIAKLEAERDEAVSDALCLGEHLEIALTQRDDADRDHQHLRDKVRLIAEYARKDPCSAGRCADELFSLLNEES